MSTFFAFGRVDIAARSPVMMPSSSIVCKVAFSSLSAKALSSGRSSSSPRLRSAPVHANSVATEFVEVVSPFKYL